jgi:endonuclease/exonuclease/phosphatase family metal-dependent hydrolase
MEFRLVTWNLHGLPPPVRFGAATDIRRAADEVFRRSPDVALFQEVWSESYAEDIARRCKGAGYAPVLLKQGGRSTGGLAMLYRLAGWSSSKPAFTTFRRHASALRIWEGDGISHKGVLATVLTSVNTGVSVAVATTHLQSQYGSHHFAEVRSEQIRELEAAIAPLGPSKQPTILAGDLNTTPTDPLYSELQQQWIDLTAGYRQRCELDKSDSCGTYFASNVPNEWIDYVLVRRAVGGTVTANVQLIHNKKKDDPFSDHEGLQADISITMPLSAGNLVQRFLHQLSDPGLVTRRNSISILLGFSGHTPPSLGRPHRRG